MGVINNKKPESIEKKDVVFLVLFKFIVNTFARYIKHLHAISSKKSINSGVKRFLNQTSWVEIQVAHSTANTSANKETQLKVNLI